MADSATSTIEPLDAFAAQQEVLESILDTGKYPSGVVLHFSTSREALSFRLRCYDLRRRDRRNTTKIYPIGHPHRGHSAYDPITLSVEGITLRGYLPARPPIESATSYPKTGHR